MSDSEQASVGELLSFLETHGPKKEVTTADVVDYLETNGHVGKENAITVAQIASALRVKNRDITDYNTRNLVKSAMDEQLYPICSCSDGYYIAEDGWDVDETMADYQNRIRGIEDRMQLLARAWQYHKKNRLENDEADQEAEA